MNSVAADILPYMLSVIGALIVYVLNGIKTEVRDVKNSVNALEIDLRAGMSGLDRRVTAVETRQQMEHDNK